jgi:3-methyladenine DNA glycosylase AlkD
MNARTFSAAIRRALAPLADPEKATGMYAYMKDQFDFLGIQTPARRQATRALIRQWPGDPATAAAALWQLPEREYQYVACDLLAHHAGTLTASALEPVLALVSRKSWWDTVDALAHTVGVLVARHPGLVSRMDQLIDDPDLWRRRIALLHQLGRKSDTDRERLFGYCLRRAGEHEFFIRKAIGWALRDYAWHDPAAVAAFLRSHGQALSALSRREAGKHLGPDPSA